MMKTWAAIVAVSLFASGCATSRSSDAGTQQFLTIQDAAMSVASIAVLTKGQIKTIRIVGRSPVLDTESLKGKFEILDVQGSEGAKFSFGVAAVCSCFGSKAYVVPKLFVTDIDGKIIAAGEGGHGISQVVTGVFAKDGQYRIVVVADAAQEDQPIGSMDAGPLPIAGVWMHGRFTTWGQSTGPVSVQWKAQP